jgi:N-acetylmuramoyl-L-alanine amidase
MNIALLKKAALQSVALMLAVITSSFALQQYKTVAISASNILEEDIQRKAFDQARINILSQDSISLKPDAPEAATGGVILASNHVELTVQADSDIINKLGDSYLAIKKPQVEGLSIKLSDLYINHSIQIDISGLKEDNFDQNAVFRVREKELYRGDPIYREIATKQSEGSGTDKEVMIKDYGKDPCHAITIATKKNNTGLYDAQLLLELDSVYAYIIYEDDNNYYIDLRKPSEVYDKIIVIDAGHGGKDAGALSNNKIYYEKDINLAIVLQLKKLLDQENIKVYYTRIADDKVFLRPRVTLANNVDCDFFISIHCNSNEVTSPNGTEILYYNHMVKGISNQSLAKLFSEEIAKMVSLRCRGVIEKQLDDIFILEQSKVPAILIEVGYLSNNNDLNYLSESKNIKKIARGIYNSIMKAYEVLPATRE